MCPGGQGLRALALVAVLACTDLELHDDATGLHVSDRYTTAELEVEPGHWLLGRRLRDLRRRDEGVVVLGVQRRRIPYLGVPRGRAELHHGDVLVLCGETDAAAVSTRPPGPEGEAPTQRPWWRTGSASARPPRRAERVTA